MSKEALIASAHLAIKFARRHGLSLETSREICDWLEDPDLTHRLLPAGVFPYRFACIIRQVVRDDIPSTYDNLDDTDEFVIEEISTALYHQEIGIPPTAA